LVWRVENRERLASHLKTVKQGPDRPPNTSKNSDNTDDEDDDDDQLVRPIYRTGTLPPEEYAHQFVRVQYHKHSNAGDSIHQVWSKDDPEFIGFLDALPPIHRAAAMGDSNRLDDLLNGDNASEPWSDPDPVHRHDRTGWDFIGAPPIHLATYFGQENTMRYLLRFGASIEDMDAAGTKPLHAAAWTGNEHLFRVLLEKGANPDARDHDGWNVEIYAMLQGQDKIISLLSGLRGGEETVPDRCSVRIMAKVNREERLLASLNRNSVQNSRTEKHQLYTEALAGAAEGGHVELVAKLLEMGADPRAIDDTGSTALHWAGWGGHTEIGNAMYTELDSVDADSNSAFGSQKHEQVVEVLMNAGALIDAQNLQGCTPLHWVAGAGSSAMVQCFLSHGASIDIKDDCSRTPVQRAEGTGDSFMTAQLSHQP
jgi:ankyrin repeat protein